MSFFKKGDTHMGIITKVVNEDGRDPDIKKVGIITLEDIIEELLMEEIEDEAEADEIKEDRKRVKDKLYLLFSDH
jgi:metal transporter CNNM